MANIEMMRKVCQPDHKKLTDPMMEWYLIRPFSIYITAFLNWLGTTPDMATSFGFLLVLIGSALVVFSHTASLIALGFALFVLAFVMDCVDGELARLQKKSSIRGIFLDYIVGGINDGMIMASITVLLLRIVDLNVSVIVFTTIFVLYLEKLIGLYAHSVVFRNIRNHWDDVDSSSNDENAEKKVWRTISFKGRLLRVVFETFFRTVFLFFCVLAYYLSGQSLFLLLGWTFAILQGLIASIFAFRSEYFKKRVEISMYSFIKALKSMK